MEIEVKVTAATEVAVDVTVTPVDGRFPGPPDAQRSRFVISDDLVLERIDNKRAGKRPSTIRATPACRHAFRFRDDPPCGGRQR